MGREKIFFAVILPMRIGQIFGTSLAMVDPSNRLVLGRSMCRPQRLTIHNFQNHSFKASEVRGRPCLPSPRRWSDWLLPSDSGDVPADPNAVLPQSLNGRFAFIRAFFSDEAASDQRGMLRAIPKDESVVGAVVPTVAMLVHNAGLS